MLLHLQANLSILRPSQKSLVAAESSTSQILLLIVFHALNLFALKLSKSREAKEGGCELNLKKGELQCHGSREGKKKAFMEKNKKVLWLCLHKEKKRNFFLRHQSVNQKEEITRRSETSSSFRNAILGDIFVDASRCLYCKTCQSFCALLLRIYVKCWANIFSDIGMLCKFRRVYFFRKKFFWTDKMSELYFFKPVFTWVTSAATFYFNSLEIGF